MTTGTITTGSALYFEDTARPANKPENSIERTIFECSRLVTAVRPKTTLKVTIAPITISTPTTEAYVATNGDPTVRSPAPVLTKRFDRESSALLKNTATSIIPPHKGYSPFGQTWLFLGG